MKCGTTSLYEMLTQHPHVASCRMKEPHYFARDRSFAYEELWAHDDLEKTVRLEASTSYTKFPSVKNVPERIREYGLSPKFIYLVRDPIDRIESQYNFMLHHLGGRPRGFDDPHLTSLSMYYMQMERFLRVFPEKDRYLILDFDWLVSQPGEALRACTNFLGLEQGWDIKHRTSNRTAASASDVWINRLGRLKNSIGRLLPSRIRIGIKHGLRLATPSIRRSVTPDDRNRLTELLRPDLQEFADTFNFDITKWGM